MSDQNDNPDERDDLTTTFCHECGHVGPVLPPALACCPDNKPRPVRAETAFYARAGFLASIAPETAEPPALADIHRSHDKIVEMAGEVARRYEVHNGHGTWTDPAYRQDVSTWNAAWRAALTPPPEQASTPRAEPVAPWPDFLGQPIHHGDRLTHPDGTEFVAVYLRGQIGPSDAWRAVYDGASISRLCLQVGDKGRAVLALPPSTAPEATPKVDVLHRKALQSRAMKATLTDDGVLEIRGDSAPEMLALTAWHALWARRAAGMRVQVVERIAPGLVEVAAGEVEASPRLRLAS